MALSILYRMFFIYKVFRGKDIAVRQHRLCLSTLLYEGFTRMYAVFAHLYAVGKRLCANLVQQLVPIALALVVAGCSLKENTARNRFIHSFTTRYNVYYNAKVAYDKGELTKIEGHKDDYTERLPVFMVGNEQSWGLGQADFNTAILKSEKAIKLHSITRKPVINNTKKRTPKQKAFLSQKEYNPFLFNAWFLMGKAQFESGKFAEAASVFSYMMRLYANDAIIRQGAATWLARCYAQMGWLYDAEDVLQKVRRDSLRQPVRTAYNATMADFYLRKDSLDKALPYLEATIRQTRNSHKRARLYYLQGQIYYALQQNELAYKALQRCTRLSPPYELAFNARILQAEVMGERNSSQMLARLKRMSRSANNANYLDQVYYAIGNIHLAQGDTAQAIKAYEEGELKAKRSDINKGVLLLRLGELYWQTQHFAGAQRCYAQVVGLLNKTHPKYEEATLRSSVLDELVPHTTVIAEQDSLLALAQLPENERLKVIEQAIATYKKQEKEAARHQRDSLQAIERLDSEGSVDGEEISESIQPIPTAGANTGEWYFYNMQMVAQGKTEFRKRWGNRPNEDDWRRTNKTTLKEARIEDIADTDTIEHIERASEEAMNVQQVRPPHEDPHQPAYYLARIPLSEEQQQEAHARIQEALWQAGQIEHDKLQELRLAEATYLRLYKAYPTFAEREALCYQLFLLYKRLGDDVNAEVYRSHILEVYPDGGWARLLRNPNYERMVREGKAIEDALYTNAYQAFTQGYDDAVHQAITQSLEDYPEGEHRDRFMMLDALLRLRKKNTRDAMEVLRALLQQHPSSDVAPVATSLLQGLEAGRNLVTGQMDFNALWQQRTALAQSDIQPMLEEQREFSPNRQGTFVCVVAFMPDSVDRDELLYQLSRYNFTNFVVRNFAINMLSEGGLQQMRIAGFKSYDEVRAYATQLLANKVISPYLKRTKLILISEENLRKIGLMHSFSDYETFHTKVFTPLRIDVEQNLDANTPSDTQRYQENLPLPLLPEVKEVVAPSKVETPTQQTQPEEASEEEDVWYDIE